MSRLHPLRLLRVVVADGVNVSEERSMAEASCGMDWGLRAFVIPRWVKTVIFDSLP